MIALIGKKVQLTDGRIFFTIRVVEFYYGIGFISVIYGMVRND